MAWCMRPEVGDEWLPGVCDDVLSDEDIELVSVSTN